MDQPRIVILVRRHTSDSVFAALLGRDGKVGMPRQIERMSSVLEDVLPPADAGPFATVGSDRVTAGQVDQGKLVLAVDPSATGLA